MGLNTYNIKCQGLKCEINFVDTYAPKDSIAEFDAEDIDSRRVVCNCSRGIVDADIWRVLWRIDIPTINYLGQGTNDEETKFFQYIIDNTDIKIQSDAKCSAKSEVVLYYELKLRSC